MKKSRRLAAAICMDELELWMDRDLRAILDKSFTASASATLDIPLLSRTAAEMRRELDQSLQTLAREIVLSFMERELNRMLALPRRRSKRP